MNKKFKTSVHTHCYPIVWAGHSTNDTFFKRGESQSVSLYPDSRSDTNNKPMDYFTYVYLQYSGVLLTLHSPSALGHACILYTNVMPIGTCSLMLTLEGGWLQLTSKYSYQWTPMEPWENTTVEWVFCSSHFEDFVLITLDGLNDKSVNSNNQELSIKQIKKVYFYHMHHHYRTHKCKQEDSDLTS